MTELPVTLSVVVPVRDAKPWIGELLESVASQHLTGFELILVDNGSSDGTFEYVRAQARVDQRIVIVESAALTAGGARNEGVRHATGEYLVFADADDIVPDGAYRAMLDSLEASGSDMAIGDHLKFSANRTWSPTKRWYSFDEARRGVTAGEIPELLSGRPCWNRIFRRSFWDRAELRFPEVPSVEDIEPMTRAFVMAASIDVVPACVYLYRERGDVSSLSLRADAAATVRYFEQEAECAVLVHNEPALRSQHAEVVLDADGWAHLQRFLSTEPDDDDVEAVAAACCALLDLIPLDGLGAVAPVRRALWVLVMAGRWTGARAFVSGTTSAAVTDQLGAWVDAVIDLARTNHNAAGVLALEGLVPALVNGAEGIDQGWLTQRLAAVSELELPRSGSALPDAMAAALRSGSGAAVAAVSALRHVVPLVIDHARVTSVGLTVEGPADLSGRGLDAVLELAGPAGQHVVASARSEAGRWRAELASEALTPGRWASTAVFAGVEGAFPVVTARMPLPPVEEGFVLQPLADRKNGWRFLVDRREPRRRGIAGLWTKVGRKLG